MAEILCQTGGRGDERRGIHQVVAEATVVRQQRPALVAVGKVRLQRRQFIRVQRREGVRRESDPAILRVSWSLIRVIKPG